MRFTHRNRSYRIDPQSVLRALQAVEPETVRRHWVEVGGRVFPVNQAFEVATGIHRSTFTTDLPSRTFRRLGFPTGQVGRGPNRPLRSSEPVPVSDREALAEAAVELVRFLREESLTKTLPRTEGNLAGGDRERVREVRLDMAGTRPMVDVARLLWQERGKLRQIANATTVIVALEAILEDGERIKTAPSLRAAHPGDGFDLVTSVRVANFELEPIDSETRQRVLFQRYVDLALDTSERVAQLWVAHVSDARQFLFESDKSASWGLQRSSRALRERFEARYGSLDVEIWQFVGRYGQHVQVRDIRPVVATIPH